MTDYRILAEAWTADPRVRLAGRTLKWLIPQDIGRHLTVTA